MEIKFANGQGMEFTASFEGEEYYNGYSRRVLTVEFDPDKTGIDRLNRVLSDEDNLAQITLTGTAPVRADQQTAAVRETVTNIFDGYVLKLECGIKSVLRQPETNGMPAVYTEKLIAKLGRRTYIEQALKNLGL